MSCPISVVIITKNEEGRIRDCLESAKGFADEIIVVDDESSDTTRQIAFNYTDIVFMRRMDIEGRHRNWAYAQAKNEWILSIDADERLTEALKRELEETVRTNPPYNGFTIPRKNFLGDYWLQWGGQYPSAQLKLFRKDKFKWEEVEVHPRAFMDGDSGRLEEPLLHYTYRDFGDYLRKLNAQTTLEARKWFALSKTDPRKANYKMYLTHALWRMLDRFIRTFFAKRGYRDGFVGFMVAFFASLYQMMSYAKYWELKGKEQ